MTDLDDASRNMAICMGQAAMAASLLATGGNVSGGQGKLLLAQTCMGASQLLYTVSETAGSMYEQYLVASSSLQQREEEGIGKCMGILQKQRPPK